MRWNIDLDLSKVLKLLEEDGLDVSIRRVLLDHSLFPKFGLQVIDVEKSSSIIWMIRIPWKTSFLVSCGHSIHEAYLKLRKKLRKEKIWKVKRRGHFKNERRRSDPPD